MGFFRQVYWSGLPSSLGDLPDPGSNPGLLHCRQTLYHLSHQGSPLYYMLVLKSRDSTLPTKVGIVKAVIFPVVIYKCESWTIKKAEYWKFYVFELRCWRRLLRVPWTARRSNQSILKEINPEYLWKVWCWSANIWPPNAKSQLIGKDPDAGKDWGQEEKRATEDEMVGWHHWFHGHEFEQTPGDSEGQWSLACYSPWGWTRLIDWATIISVQLSSVTQSCPTLRPHELQHTRLPCPSPTPGVYSNSCPLSWWCHPTISSSVIPFSSRLQSFPASGSFQMSQFFTSGGQHIGVSASSSVLPMNIQDWFSLVSIFSFRNNNIQVHNWRLGILRLICTRHSEQHNTFCRWGLKN